MKKLFSAGNDCDSQLGRAVEGNNRQTFQPVTIVIDQEKVVNMQAGRSHTLYTTLDGSLMAFGRNDYGQCGFQQKGLRNLVHCMYKTETGETMEVKSPKLFSTGWFHSLMVKDERLYACGYFSFSPISGQQIFTDVTNLVIKHPFKEITFVGSGDHVFTIVVDNNRIIHGNSDLMVFRVDNIKEVCSCKSGFCYISTEEKIYQLEARDIAESKEYSGFGCYDLRASSVGNFCFKSKKLEKTIIGADEYSLDCKVFPSFCSYFVYYPNKRKLHAHGSNSDHQLGLGSGGTAKASEVESINSVLLENPNWDLLDVVCGCDFTVILLGVPFSKDILRFRNNLWNYSNKSLLTNVEFKF